MPGLAPCLRYRTPAGVVAQIDRLLDDHTDAEIAVILNEQGIRSVWARHSMRSESNARRSHRLVPRRVRLRKTGLLTANEPGRLLGITGSGVRGKNSRRESSGSARIAWMTRAST
ncbi:MAG: hypothetical protein IPI67_00010 [Myxococcales bacterium]|nr:hypothetical protein [Myxococcales bacterium]